MLVYVNRVEGFLKHSQKYHHGRIIEIEIIGNLEMLSEDQEEQAALSSGDVLEEAGHVRGQPTEHAVLVLVQVLVIHHLLPTRLHVHLHLVLGGKLQTLLDALKRVDKRDRVRSQLFTCRMLQPITETIMSIWWIRKRGSSMTV